MGASGGPPAAVAAPPRAPVFVDVGGALGDGAFPITYAFPDEGTAAMTAVVAPPPTGAATMEVEAVAVTVKNFRHQWSADVVLALEAPGGGARAVLVDMGNGDGGTFSCV